VVGVLIDTVEAFRREMAKKFHPDRGGDPEVMKAVNGLVDSLVKKLKEV
jgi:hypothetical protein